MNLKVQLISTAFMLGSMVGKVLLTIGVDMIRVTFSLSVFAPKLATLSNRPDRNVIILSVLYHQIKPFLKITFHSTLVALTNGNRYKANVLNIVPPSNREPTLKIDVVMSEPDTSSNASKDSIGKFV